MTFLEKKFHHHHESQHQLHSHETSHKNNPQENSDKNLELAHDLHHALAFHPTSSDSLFRLGLMMVLSVSLHNLPEGFAIGSIATVSFWEAALVLVSLLIHNIPEGMAMVQPFKESGAKPIVSLFWVSLSGVVTVIGGMLGASLGHLDSYYLGLCLAIAAGCMGFVSCFELLPHAMELVQGNKRTVIISFILSIFLSFFLLLL